MPARPPASAPSDRLRRSPLHARSSITSDRSWSMASRWSIDDTRGGDPHGRPGDEPVSSRRRTSTARCAAAVVEHEVPDLVGKWARCHGTPVAGLLAFGVGGGRARRPDCVGRGTQLVGRDMPDRRGLAGGVRGVPRRPGQVPGRGVGMAGCRARLRPRDLAARPRTSRSIARRGRSSVRPRPLEVVQHVLRAVSRPHGEQAWSSSWRLPRDAP